MTKQGIAQASILSLSASLGMRILDFLILILLARVLSPTDFGIVAMATAIFQVVETIAEVPIATGILRSKKSSPSLINSAFTLAFIRGVIMSLTLLAMSMFMNSFYHDERISYIILLFSLIPIFRGVINPRIYLLQRQFNYLAITSTQLLARMLAFIVSITIVLVYKSYWAIAIYTFVSPALVTVFSYIITRYKPVISLTGWKDFSDLIGWSTLNQILWAFNIQSDRLVLGWNIPSDIYGKYSMSINLVQLPQRALLDPISAPIIAYFSKQNTLDLVGKAYCNVSQITVLIGLPVFILLGAYSDAVILILFGESWLDAADYVYYLSFVGVLSLPVLRLQPAVVAVKKTKNIVIAHFLEFLIRLALLLTLIPIMGTWGAIWALILAGIARVIILSIVTKYCFNVGLLDQIFVQIRNIMSGGALIAAAHLLSEFLVVDNGYPLLLSSTLGVVVVSMMLYGLIVILLWKISGKPKGAESYILNLIFRN